MISVVGFSMLRMIFVQVMRLGHLQDFLQTVEDIENKAMVNIACVLKSRLLIRPCD